MIVVDASLLVGVLTDGGDTGQTARGILSKLASVYVPDIAYADTVGLLRRLWLRGALVPDRCRTAVEDLNDLPLVAFPTGPLLWRVCDLWARVTARDACYVALAEALGCDLITGNRRLATVTGVGCNIRTVNQEKQ